MFVSYLPNGFGHVRSGAWIWWKDLRGADLSGADLRRIVLNRTDLRDTDLSGAIMSKADMRNANMRSANIRNANLSGANLSCANLRGADLSNADLSCANLRGADLSNADLSCANLSGTNMSNADMRRADLSNVGLHGANLSGASGIPSPSEWMAGNFEQSPDGWIVYRAEAGIYHTPPHWRFEPGSFLTETPNYDRATTCGCGVSFATLDWVRDKFPNSRIWKCLIPWSFATDIVIPYNTDGKARCAKLQLLEVVS